MDRSWCVYKLVRFYHSLHLRKLVAKAGTDLAHFPTAMEFISLVFQVAGSSQSYQTGSFSLYRRI
jgi:hypothetical protein